MVKGEKAAIEGAWVEACIQKDQPLCLQVLVSSCCAGKERRRAG